MKRNILFFNILLPLLIIGLPKASSAVTVYCSNYTCASNPSPKLAGEMCATTTKKCYGNSNTAVVSCATCPDGYMLTSATEELQPVGETGTCTVRYSSCVKEATITPDPGCDGTCDDCENTDWENYYGSGFPKLLGYQRKVMAACNIRTCVCTKTYFYRCADGYYGSTLNGTSGCSQCPGDSSASSLITGNSIAGSNGVITQCFVEKGDDSTGSYVYTSECYYTN